MLDVIMIIMKMPELKKKKSLQELQIHLSYIYL